MSFLKKKYTAHAVVGIATAISAVAYFKIFRKNKTQPNINRNVAEAECCKNGCKCVDNCSCPVECNCSCNEANEGDCCSGNACKCGENCACEPVCNCGKTTATTSSIVIDTSNIGRSVEGTRKTWKECKCINCKCTADNHCGCGGNH